MNNTFNGSKQIVLELKDPLVYFLKHIFEYTNNKYINRIMQGFGIYEWQHIP